jgi:hypothetical protein
MKRSVAVLASAVSAVVLLRFGYRLNTPDVASENRIQAAS